MKKRTVALLSGGISSEREVSLKSGDQVYEALDKDAYNVVRYDPKTDLVKLAAEAGAIDFALIILHGPFGEDGTIQGMLDLLDIPYQGSGVLGSATAMNKWVSKRLYESAGLPVPPYAVLEERHGIQTADLVERLGLPMVIKPAASGSSVGMSIVDTAEALPKAFDKAFAEDRTVIAEAYVNGIEITGGVIGNDDVEPLPLIEIIPGADHAFFDYEAKYTPGATQEICPARISEALTRKAQDYAVRAHRALHCRGYSRTDMILRDDELYVLETNTIPGMTRTSLFPQAAAKGGLSFSRLMDRLIELGLEDHGH